MSLNHIDFQTIADQLDALHIKDILNPKHPSYYLETNSYQLLIVRFFTIEYDELEGLSIPYILKNNMIYRYDRNTSDFVVYNSLSDLLRSIELHSKKAERLIEHYLDEIDNLEDALYSRKIPTIFLDLWFDLKKDLTRIDRMLDRIYTVLQDFAEIHIHEENFPHDMMSNILEHTQRYQRLANLHTMKLDTLYSYYNSLKNDKINNNIYVLTILSGIFLPLNLIVGFFGMNTQNLFLNQDPDGTMKVVFILGAMFLILLGVFPIAKITHRYILQKVLNKFHIYNKIVSKFKTLGKK